MSRIAQRWAMRIARGLAGVATLAMFTCGAADAVDDAPHDESQVISGESFEEAPATSQAFEDTKRISPASITASLPKVANPPKNGRSGTAILATSQKNASNFTRKTSALAASPRFNPPSKRAAPNSWIP